MSLPRAWLLPALAAALLAPAACGGDGGPAGETPTPPAATPTATPAPTPTPIPEFDGFEGFRLFAARIAEAVAAGDGAFFAQRGVEREQTCAGDEVLPPCLGQEAGTVLRGIPLAVAESDAFSLESPQEYAEDISRRIALAQPDLRDDYGPGGAALFAIAHRPEGPRGPEAYQAVITAIVSPRGEPLRQARILSFQFSEGRWRLIEDLFATVSPAAAPWLTGDCEECYDRWQRWEEVAP